jgi:selenocysteine lyase/cysteine desulfurase
VEGAARFDPGWVSSAVLAGLLSAIEIRPQWAFERAAEQAARCRDLLVPLVELVPGDATLVAFRHDDPAALVERLAEAGVVVREIPKTGLVRVSCGWWTNEDDLGRLASAIAA